MTPYRFAEHTGIAAFLAGLDHAAFLQCQCFFGGGTAIVLTHGEYRLSRDVDFLCADQAGYRDMRLRMQQASFGGLFPPDATLLREVRADQYGIRTIVGFRDLALRFEIIREARIALAGHLDPALGTPILHRDDLMAEKLLANADRCDDPATACRDAIDLGMLVAETGRFSEKAVATAEAAYGDDIRRKALAVARRLMRPADRQSVAVALAMQPDVATQAAEAFLRACAAQWGEFAPGL